MWSTFVDFYPSKQKANIKDNIKLDLQEVGRGCGDWMDLAQNRGSWRALVSTVVTFGVP